MYICLLLLNIWVVSTDIKYYKYFWFYQTHAVIFICMNVTKNLAFQILSEFGLVGMVLFQNIVVESMYSRFFRAIHILCYAPKGTMPWNVLGTPQKFKFRIREKWKFQPHNWVNNQKTVIEILKTYFVYINLGWYIQKKKKPFGRFFQIFHFLQYHFFPLCCRFAMAWHGKSLTMNFSCPDSKFWLDDWKVLGFCGVLYSETFKALWPVPPQTPQLRPPWQNSRHEEEV